MSWVQSTLGEVADIFSGYAFKSADMNSEGGTPLIKIKNIADSAVSHECDAFLNKDFNLAKFERFHLLRDDFLVAMTGQGSVGRIGKMMDYKPGFYVNQRVAIVRVNPEKANPVFIFYQIATRSNELELFKKANGAGQPNISAKQIGELPVVLPSTEQQQYIADVLSSYDDLIENNQKQIKLLEEAAQRLYKEWFVDLRFPGHENITITDGIPEGRTVQSMNDIAEYINGYAFKPTDWGTVGKPIIKIKEMGSGVTTDTPRNTGEGIPEKYNVTAGDILFSWSATLSAMIWDEEDGLLNQHLFKVIPGEGISREFVFQSILKTLDEFSNLTTGSTMKHIQRGKLKEVKVNVPPTELMEQYRNISKPIRERILNVKQQTILLREARDRLLPKLMSGEIEV